MTNKFENFKRFILESIKNVDIDDNPFRMESQYLQYSWLEDWGGGWEIQYLARPGDSSVPILAECTGTVETAKYGTNSPPSSVVSERLTPWHSSITASVSSVILLEMHDPPGLVSLNNKLWVMEIQYFKTDEMK